MKRALIVVVAVLAVLAVVFYLFFIRKETNLIKSEFPDYFPKKMIEEPYVVNLEALSDTFLLPDEKHRTQISYISHWTIAENEKSFSKYLASAGFLLETKDSKDQEFIFGKKDKSSISVTLWKGTPVRVTVLFIINK